MKPSLLSSPFSSTRRRAIAAVSLGVLLPGCAIQHDEDHRGEQVPSTTDFKRPIRHALVLSSGGPRGFVHVGVIKALDELGCQPDLVCGSSVGALVAAFYADGKSGKELESLAMDIKPFEFARLAIGANERLSSTAIYSFVQKHCRSESIEKTSRCALAIAAVQKNAGRLHLFNRGDIGLAVQASSAIEGRLTPVHFNGDAYVDADLFSPMPVRATRRLAGAPIRVLSVDASAHESKAPENAQRFRDTDLRKRALTQPDAVDADINLHPEFGYWVRLSEEYREQAINAGYRSTMEHANAIKALFKA